MTALPDFTLDAYGGLLDALAASGYTAAPVTAMADAAMAGAAADVAAGPTVYLRHDVDFSLARLPEMAAVEAARGVRATYYVALTQPYNPFSAAGRAVVRALAEAGHEIGLHYDLTAYPERPDARRGHLAWELDALARVAGAPVRTLCMHQPFLGTPDPFRSLGGLVHPHDPRLQAGVVYVSDSCRAWRDETLLTAFGPGRPPRLLLNTHPELWLGRPGTRRMDDLPRILGDATAEHRTYFEHEVAGVWTTHDAPRRHDAREAARP